MSTRSTIEQYFERLAQRGDWQSSFADDMTFTSHAGPGKEITGRQAFVQSTRGFYGMIRQVSVRKLLIDGDDAVAETRYALEAPNGPKFASDVAEVFTVKNDRITSFGIYFDTAPYPK